MHQFLKKKKDWLQQQLSEAFLPVHELAALLFFKIFLHRIFAADCFPNAYKKTISQKKNLLYCLDQFFYLLVKFMFQNINQVNNTS